MSPSVHAAVTRIFTSIKRTLDLEYVFYILFLVTMAATIVNLLSCSSPRAGKQFERVNPGALACKQDAKCRK